MGSHPQGPFPDTTGGIFVALGLAAQYFLARRLRLPRWLNLCLLCLVGTLFALTDERMIPSLLKGMPPALVEDYVPGAILVWSMGCLGALLLSFALDRIPKFDPRRRGFLRTSTIAACAVPAAMMGAAVITRKDFQIQEIDLRFPDLPKGLNGLRLLQISDIHLSSFFSRSDLRRVVDASNGLRADLAFVTGDLITTKRDPLDDCLLELKRLRSNTGVWGCMGNHEAYIRGQKHVKEVASRYGMDFLRHERRSLRFGDANLNLVGVDHQFAPPYLPFIDGLVQPGDFNLLLSHTPVVFEDAQEKGFQLTLSGHTHGGQINLELAGTNFNIVDLASPYTRGLYWRGASAIYVNSGLGTIGIPARIGAPPEISVIRLCNS